jgi:hypothetical protein
MNGPALQRLGHLSSSAHPINQQLIPLFTVISVAEIMAVLCVTHAWTRCFFGRTTRHRQRDEEQARRAVPPLSSPESWRESWVSLDEVSRYSRPSSTAPILPAAVPPAYLPRTWQEDASQTDRPPRPLPNLPPLCHSFLPVACAEQQSPQASPAPISANDSKESIGTEMPSLYNTPASRVSPSHQSSPRIQNRFANDSTESFETEAADSSSLTPQPSRTPALSAVRCYSPLSLSRQAHIQTGTVAAHKAVLASPVTSGSDDARGQVVSSMVTAIDRDRFSNFSSKAKSSDPGELPPSPLLRSVLNRISNVRERWTHIDQQARRLTLDL